MAQSSWPSPATSRTVDDYQYERLGISWGPVAGLIGSPADSDLVYGDSSGMQVKIRADRYGYVRGYEWWSGASELTRSITSNASGSTRYDMVVLRLSRTTWNVTHELIAGTPGAGVPALTQATGNSGTWELPVAIVTVPSGAATISAAQVQYLGIYLTNDGSGYVVNSTNTLPYIPHPFNGQIVTVAGLSRLYQYNGSAWARFPKVPYYTELGSNVLASTSEGTVFSQAWTVAAGDIVKLTVNGVYAPIGADRQLTIRLKEDGTVFHGTSQTAASTKQEGFTVVAMKAPAAGSHTYTVTCQMDSFTGNILAGTEFHIELAG